MKRFILALGLVSLGFAESNQIETPQSKPISLTQEQKEAIFIKQLQTTQLHTLNDGKLISSEKAGNKDYHILYYSASWCPPCHKFTPVLSSFHNENHNKSAKSFDITLINLDESERDMVKYVTKYKMPFNVAPFNGNVSILAQEIYPPKYLPTLVVLDNDGKVITQTFAQGNKDPFEVLADIEKLISK